MANNFAQSIIERCSTLNIWMKKEQIIFIKNTFEAMYYHLANVFFGHSNAHNRFYYVLNFF